MHSKSDNIKIVNNDEADEVIEELFELLLNSYQNNFKKLMRGSELVFNYVHSLYYKCHEIDPNCGRSYLDSPDWIKNKKNKKKQSR